MTDLNALTRMDQNKNFNIIEDTKDTLVSKLMKGLHN